MHATAGCGNSQLGRWQLFLAFLGFKKKQADGEAHASKPNSAAQKGLGRERNGRSISLQAPVDRAGLQRSYKDIKALVTGSSEGSDNPERSDSALMKMRSLFKISLGKKKQQTPRKEGLDSAEPLTADRPPGEGLRQSGSVDILAVARPSRPVMPPNEGQRQATLDVLGIVHTSQDDPQYAQIVDLAASLLDVPVVILLIADHDRLWFKAVHLESMEQWKEIPRKGTPTSHLILGGKHEVMVVEDTQEDARYSDEVVVPAVRMKADGGATPQTLRFFAGAPLIAPNGYIMGGLSIGDFNPRKLDADSFSLLINLAEIAMRAMLRDAGVEPASLPPPAETPQAFRRASQESSVRGGGKRKLFRAGSKRHSLSKDVGVAVCDAGFQVLFMDNLCTSLSGATPLTAGQPTLWQLFGLAEGEALDIVDTDAAVLCDREAEVRVETRGGRVLRLAFRSATGALDQYAPLVGVPSFVEANKSRNMRCFIVLVRAERPGESAVGESPSVARAVECPNPFMAFASAKWDESEPWGDQLQVNSEEHLSEAQTQVSNLLMTRESIAVPYNEGVFSAVEVGPILGIGGFGRVHRAEWLGRQIALKIIDTFQEEDIGERVKVLTEARIMADATHPNLVQTYTHATRFKPEAPQLALLDTDGSDSSGESKSIMETWLLLEYCNKGSLQGAIDRGWFKTERSQQTGVPDLNAILATALELAEALEYLHSLGIVHGDLTPANILLSDCSFAQHGFTAKVADFGLSRRLENNCVHTATFGTVTHMPPELLSHGTLTTAADVYSYGVLLWSMYMGMPAWQGLRRTQVIYKVTTMMESLPIPPDCPPFLKDLLERTLQRDHLARPSFRELVREVERLISLEQQGWDLHDCSLDFRPPSSRTPMRWQQELTRKSYQEEAVCSKRPTAPQRCHSSALAKLAQARRPYFSPEGIRLETA